MKIEQKHIKKTFRKKGTCSQTFAYILNHEFEQPRTVEEVAVDPLAGGIIGKGHQCGMLWGSSVAVGAEAYRRFDNIDEAIGITIVATQAVMESFISRTSTSNCREITNCDWSKPWSVAKYFLSGKMMYCFNLARDWAPEAIDAAMKGLSHDKSLLPPKSVSCACEVAKRMGATDEQIVMVAGFAGGMGLSGGGCGALGAAIWMNTLDWVKEHPGKSSFSNPNAKQTLETFQKAIGDDLLCSEITGRNFKDVADHSEFIMNGGCADLIDLLVETRLEAN